MNGTSATVDHEAAPHPAALRLTSLDALRGFDMCWILGLAAVVEQLLKRFDVSWRGEAVEQLEHVKWEGFHFYDLIFPLFLFLAGVSLAIALPRRVARDGTGAAARKLLVRAAILFLVGVIYSGGMQKGIDGVRWLGVLQRIALGSCIAGLLSLWIPARGLVVVTIAILAGYWALLTFVPVPGESAGNYAEGHNLTNYLDRTYLPGRKYDGDHDPEGILSTLPAMATALLGILAGKWITGATRPSLKVLGMIAGGGVLLAAGWAWHLQFPVVKKLWTSSFVLVAGGWSAMFLGVFYLIIDVWHWKRWAAPFVWVGANPITLYVASGLGFFQIVTLRLTGKLEGDWAWVPAVVSFALVLLVARYLYKREIFVRA